ncbi:hypothetical protein BDM02DRAFT_495077 [Thelephora ganbajun]|uniref:Uncharacterized protein n=1 Tax=Thelephora ganbajun TaxID=370292 RepID=A0ACB6Z7R2_THEGA|nr:hypothetical protein BDM02DRAFT_495077 [Thelephora ganbajun]
MTETTMSEPHLPPEISEYIVDLLRNELDTLERCCLVSRSWVPRTRKHLFADIKFLYSDDLERWKRTFPDPSRYPTHHTHTLTIGCPEVVTAADAQEGGWIRAFSNVTRLEVLSGLRDLYGSEVSLVPFHGFSPVLKSLRVASETFPCVQILNLACSFRFLEDLDLAQHMMGVGIIGRDRTVFQPSTSPVLTGTLRVYLPGRMGCVTRRLLNLPCGLHFRKLEFSCYRDDNLRWMRALVVGCSNTLECVDIECCVSIPLAQKDPWTASIDLSKAIKLKEVVFRSKTLHVNWLVLALQTITSEHRCLHHISIHVHFRPFFIDDPVNVRQTVGEEIYRQWMDLDRILVRSWESYGIRPKVVYSEAGGEKETTCIGSLLPEITERGIIELVDSVEPCWYRQIY